MSYAADAAERNRKREARRPHMPDSEQVGRVVWPNFRGTSRPASVEASQGAKKRNNNATLQASLWEASPSPRGGHATDRVYLR